MSAIHHLLRILREANAFGKPSPTVDQIAAKHNVSVAAVKAQLTKGIAVEREHTNNDDIARQIALDHLFERPDYYDQLKKLEEDAPAVAAGHGAVAGLGVGPKGEPGVMLPRKKRWEKTDTFAGADVFDVEMEDVIAVPNPKLPHERFAKYVGNDPEQGEALRQHARKHWKRDIVLRDGKTGVMTFLRRRKPRG